MLCEITQEQAQSYSWLMLISVHFKTLTNYKEWVWDQASPNKKNLFAGTKWAIHPECRARLGLILPDHISNENRWLSWFIFNACKAMQPYNNGCSQTRPFFGGIGGCMDLQYMIGWCIGCASINSKNRPPFPLPSSSGLVVVWFPSVLANMPKSLFLCVNRSLRCIQVWFSCLHKSYPA